MFILDYRAADNPAHHHVAGIAITEAGVQATIATTFPALVGAPMNGFSRVADLPPILLGANPLQSVAEWLVSSEGIYPGCPLVAETDYAFEARKLDLLAAVKRNRDATRDGGCTTPAGPVDTDINSRLNIAGAVSMAAIGGAEFSVDWRMSDNSVVTMNAAEVTTMGVAVGQFVAACQARKNVLDAAIAEATTIADLDEIDVAEGWPE